jgi:hypothetical protein
MEEQVNVLLKVLIWIPKFKQTVRRCGGQGSPTGDRNKEKKKN